MQNFFPVLVILFGLLSCKTTWNVHEIKTENIPNSEKITEIDSYVIRLAVPYRNRLGKDMPQLTGFGPVELVRAKSESMLTNYLGDLIICLSHLGIQYEKTKISVSVLASQTHYTDLIVGRYTRTLLDEPFQLKNAGGRLIIVNQAGWAGMMLRRVDFLFDRTKSGKPVVYKQNAQLII